MIDQARLAGLVEADTYAASLGVRLADGDGVAVEMTVGSQHLNFLGSLHGGAMFSLADCALSIAANYESRAMAIDTHMALTGQATAGDVITATAETVTRGRRLGTYRVHVTRSDGRVIGVFTGTVLLT